MRLSKSSPFDGLRVSGVQKGNGLDACRSYALSRVAASANALRSS